MLPDKGLLALLYDDWDRDPYWTPFGLIPHDAAVRLYYLNRPACWHFISTPRAADGNLGECTQRVWHDPGVIQTVIGRQRDLPELAQQGWVNILAQNSVTRWDRAYVLAEIHPTVVAVTNSPGSGPLLGALFTW
jgi:hypothetical protein